MFIFFRCVHPIVPWDGDEWNTVGGWGTRYVFYGLPGFDLTNNVFGVTVGSVAGYIAAFIIYPLTGNYVMSFVTVNALFLAISIIIPIIWLQKMLRGMANWRISALCTVLFIVFAFLIFKSKENSEYLYWQYNQCTLYYYSLPSYYASTYYIYLIEKFLSGEKYGLNLKSSIAFAILYILMFSFVPAALLIASLSFWILVLAFIREKKIKVLLKDYTLYVLALFMFFIKLWLEFYRTFGTGYLKTPTDMMEQLKDSLLFMWSTIPRFNKLFLSISIFGCLFAVSTYVLKSIHGKLSDYDQNMKTLILLSIGVLSFVWIYFVLFGMISLQHISGLGVIHTDIMHVMYFLLVLIDVLLWSYTLNNVGRITTFMPVLLLMMACVVINPKYSYRDSYHLDCTPRQRYEIMSAIVDEIKTRNDEGVYSVIVHIPPYYHWGNSLATDLYLHNITDQVFSMQYVYDADPNTIVFE